MNPVPTCRRVAIVLLAVAAPAIHADATLPPLDRGYLTLGGYQSRNEVRGRWDDPSGRLGSDFDVARDFGFRPSTREFVWELGLRAFDSHELKVFGYDYRGSGTRTLARTLRIGGTDYAADGRFDGEVRVAIEGAAWTWFLHNDDRRAFGAGIGLVRYAVQGALSAQLTVDAQNAEVAQRFSEDAWLPLLRVAWVERFGARWRAGAELSYVRKPSGTVAGHACDAALRVEYFPLAHLGLALRYNFNRVDLDLDSARIGGRLVVENRGPQVLTTLRW
jgi:hypothetical protein